MVVVRGEGQRSPHSLCDVLKLKSVILSSGIKTNWKPANNRILHSGGDLSCDKRKRTTEKNRASTSHSKVARAWEPGKCIP